MMNMQTAHVFQPEDKLTTNIQIDDALCDTGFHIIDQFLDERHYQNLRMLIRTHQNQFKHANIGHALKASNDKRIRNDQILWLDEQTDNESIKTYFNEISKLSKTLNQSLFLGLVDFEAHFSIYEPGSFYKKHVDQFSTAKERRISCVYYLNEEWPSNFGGELILYDQQGIPLPGILPRGNRFICFNSDITHEVQITHQTRYSIAGWLKVRAIR